MLRLSYEDLSQRPDDCREQLLKFMPELGEIDLQREVSVQSIEGKVRRPITNYNEQQIASLTAEDIAEIDRDLSAVPEVMAHFGYKFLGQQRQ